jgi:hypothetical protein
MLPIKEQDEAEGDNKGAIATETNSGATRLGRVVMKLMRLIEEIGAAASSGDIGLSEAEEKYYDTMWKMSEMAFVGAGIGGGFVDTNELHVMKYKEAIAGKDAPKWEIAVEEEHECMMKHKVWEPVPIEELPKDSKVLTSTWAMKKKANGTFRARLNARGYDQIDGEHYDDNTKAAPVVNEATIRIVMILMLMAGWYCELLDVKGAFLHGEFDKGQTIIWRYQRDSRSTTH